MNYQEIIELESQAATAGAAFSEKHCPHWTQSTQEFRRQEATAASAYATQQLADAALPGPTLFTVRSGVERAFRHGGFIFRAAARRLPPRDRLLRLVSQSRGGVVPEGFERLLDEVIAEAAGVQQPKGRRPTQADLATLLRKHDRRMTIDGSYHAARALTDKFDLFEREGA